MVGVYFSGTGNSRYAAEVFCKEFDGASAAFVIATMGLFSGDGAGILGRLLEGYGACLTGGLHLKMPDSIGDEKALKRPLEKNKALVREAEIKIKDAARAYKAGCVRSFVRWIIYLYVIKKPSPVIDAPCVIAASTGVLSRR